MKSHGVNPITECPVFSEFVADLSELEHIPLPSTHTILFIAVDAHGADADEISRVAEKLLTEGLIYVCVWGQDCERIHDIFDETLVGIGETQHDFVFMSTWHSDESLEEAIWLFTNNAISLDVESEGISYVAVAVGRADWAVVVDGALSDLPALARRVLD